MSSTNRGRQRNRDDHYATPPWCLHRLLDRIALPEGSLLEPCFGTGVIVDTCAERGYGYDRWTCVETRDISVQQDAIRLRGLGTRALVGLSFMHWKPEGDRFACLLTNPPFSHALEFAKHGLEVAEVVILLLRLNWFGSEERHGWLSAHMPDCYIIPNRVGFTRNERGRVQADSVEYAWFVWRRGASQTAGRHELLDLTPKEERR